MEYDIREITEKLCETIPCRKDQIHAVLTLFGEVRQTTLLGHTRYISVTEKNTQP